MAQELIISISGVRGIIGRNLNASIAAEYGCAFGTFLKRNFADRKETLTVCVGRDSRSSGPMLASAVTAGLCSAGIKVVDLGLVTTPTTGVMVKHLDCCGGVMITASHNPIEYNGIKLLLDNGMAPPADKAAQIKQIYLNKDFALAASKDCADVTLNMQSYQIHINKVLQIVDKYLITSKGFKVVLDSVNGAGAPITKKFLAELGCQTIAINDEPSGIFEHTPEPTAENLTALCEIVKAKNVDIGFAQDPDADRLAIVDEKGRYIGEEYTLALATKYILSKKNGSVATNLATSRMIDDIAGQFGSKVIRTAVGEANVADAMIKNNCIIGGEGNGGVIDMRVGPVRDSLVAIALTLQLMAETGKKISQLVDEIPSYAMKKEKFKADGDLAKRVIDAAKQKFVEAKIDMTDGIRFDFDDGWLLLRTSNTEPIMRIMTEALDETTAEKYVGEVEKIRCEVT
ncbi:MAG: phosphoglucosamine mutase [Sedimentisphaerales bacterium]|nr:phosphoglucosamine mutase [Sedimentisphaerales bacterium]